MLRPRRVPTAFAALAAVLSLAVAGCDSPGSPDAAGTPHQRASHASGHASHTAGDSPSSRPTHHKTKQPTGPPMLLDSIAPLSDTTVGVAMPISIVFTDPVKASARREIEDHISLTTSVTRRTAQTSWT